MSRIGWWSVQADQRTNSGSRLPEHQVRAQATTAGRSCSKARRPIYPQAPGMMGECVRSDAVKALRMS